MSNLGTMMLEIEALTPYDVDILYGSATQV